MIATAMAAVAADQRADVPVMGYAFGETSRELRAILGVPGASRWSDPLPLPDGVVDLRIAPGHRWAVLALITGEVGVLTLDTRAYARLDGANAFDDVDFSPSGSAMALRNGDAVAVYTGLPDSPKRSDAAITTSGRIALSDAGTVVALSAGRLLKGAANEYVADCSETCQFGFFPQSVALAILNQGKLVEFSSSSRTIAEGLDPADLLTASAKSIALSSASKLRIVDRDSGVLSLQEELSTAVTRLETMRQNGALLLSTEEGAAAWMYSLDGVRFIPARSSAATATTPQDQE